MFDIILRSLRKLDGYRANDAIRLEVAMDLRRGQAFFDQDRAEALRLWRPDGRTTTLLPYNGHLPAVVPNLPTQLDLTAYR
ncbi:hypothetical protein GGD55_003078 [Rhizobium giardinii]|uniref:Uncharacterized protein n=1 Tax=Rhizobium giardinii TaxID=56731 RepID=A0A7W8UBL5_9HYPH|nr:hypothetical protein [Rhizobium giardinii]